MPKPPRKLAVREHLHFMEGLAARYATVHSCYEAGPTGFALHRQLLALGVKNVVIAPTCLDERRKGVNTDFTDTRMLASRLDRYVAGDPRVFTVVTVPSEQAEHRRAWSRLRQQMQGTRLRVASQGRTLALTQSFAISNMWWMEAEWQKHQIQMPPSLLGLLEVLRKVIQECNVQMKAAEEKILAIAAERALEIAAEEKSRQEQKAKEKGALEGPEQPREIKPGSIPKWIGAKTMELIDGEVCDWKRFGSARKASSYTGMIGGVAASGQGRADLSITKSGNPRLRRALVEAAWRLALNQPKYWLSRKRAAQLGLGTKTHPRQKKKAIVAYGRQLFVDLWKWRTGRQNAEDFGWEMT